MCIGTSYSYLRPGCSTLAGSVPLCPFVCHCSVSILLESCRTSLALASQQRSKMVGTNSLPPDDGRARNALVSVIMGADSELGHAVALAQAKEGARLVLLGKESNKYTLEKLGRQCARVGCPAVDVYVDGTSDPKQVHTVVSLARSRMGTIDIITACPITEAALLTQLVKKTASECVPRMQERQQTEARSSRGIITFLPSAPAEGVGVTGSILGAVGRAAAKVHGADAVASKVSPSLALAAVRQSLQGWMDDEAKRAEGNGLLFVEATVPGELYTGDMWSQDKETAERLAHEVAVAVLAPWRERSSVQFQLATQAEGKSRTPAPSLRYSLEVNKAQAEPAPKGYCDPRALSPAGPAELGEQGAREVVEAPATPDRDWWMYRTVAGGQAERIKVGGMPFDDNKNERTPDVKEDDMAAGDPEGQELGRDPGPAEPEGTVRAEDESQAIWLVPKDPPPATGIDEVSGARIPPGVLTRLRAPRELGLGKQDKPGAVITKASPENLEPETQDGQYSAEPERHPDLMVQCFQPFNGETPHSVLSKEFITPAALFYVRNHLPVPERPDPQSYRLRIGGLGVSKAGGKDMSQALELSLDDLQSGKYGPVVEQQSVLQCAGNRRNEMAAIKLVEGRAPWNHGSIGNSLWTGVYLRDVLKACGFPVDDPESTGANHVVMKGLDWHRITKLHFETSIPLNKAVDPHGGVMLAWLQNGEPLLPDHGYPLRMIVPGFVGTRSVKWIQSIELTPEESESAWQKVDYKLMPHKFHKLEQWKPVAATILPPIENMPVQSAILTPEPGTIVPPGTKALWFRGYAWCGAGLKIIRVDVTSDEGLTWELADIVERHEGPHGQAWAWVKWQIPLKVPQHLQEKGGKMRVACKAFNRNCDTQPAHVSDIWNFRGLACNSWHFCDLCVLPPSAK